jgi:hypothetical protein
MVVEVWVTEVVFLNQGKTQRLLCTHDSREDAISYLNSPTVMKLLCRHVSNKGVYWNMMVAEKRSQ